MTPSTKPFPENSELCILFSHVAYQMKGIFAERNTGIRSLETRDYDQTRAGLTEAHVLCVSGNWRYELLEAADNLLYVQSIGAGYDQFPLDELRARGIRLANARGANRNAVSEHTFSLILGLTRKIHEARDNQRKGFWRQMISNIPDREEELAGKTLGIIGMGHIGSRVAQLGKAFEMRVIAMKRNTSQYEGPADEVWGNDRLNELLEWSDVVVLNCPLTPETKGIIDRDALQRMKPSALLINVARGPCVDEEALLEALNGNWIAGAGLDVFDADALAADSPIWSLENAIVTPHTAGETQAYEGNVIDILLENIGRLQRGESKILHQII